ncbi:MAG: hypothetical protein Q9172_007052 [Xanthocarpia lactea]
MELSQILLFILYLGNTGVLANALPPRSPWGSKPWHQGKKAHGELQIHLSIALALDNTYLAIGSLKSIADPGSPEKTGQHWTAAEVARNIKPSSAAMGYVSNWFKSLEIDDERVTQSHDAGQTTKCFHSMWNQIWISSMLWHSQPPQKIIDIQVGDKYQLGNLNLLLAAFDKYYCDSLDPSIDTQYPDLGGYNKSVDCGTLPPPNVISISFTWSEADFPPQYLFRQCLEFLKLGLMGVTVLVSTSDWGTASGMEPGFCLDESNGVNNATTGEFNPSFPASCPWMTTVGGTQRTTQPHQNFTTKIATTTRAYTSAKDPENPTSETAFYFATDNRTLSSGGGFSNMFPAPYYQIADIYRYELTESEHLRTLAGKFTTTARGYPDVSAQAFGYLPIVDGGVQLIHGTSGSTPVFASIISMINNERMSIGKSSVGFINPVLYEYPDMLNDIKTGANEGCGVDPAFRASWGWDPVTGLGTPDYERMKERFLSLP